MPSSLFNLAGGLNYQWQKCLVRWANSFSVISGNVLMMSEDLCVCGCVSTSNVLPTAPSPVDETLLAFALFSGVGGPSAFFCFSQVVKETHNLCHCLMNMFF